MNTIKPKFELIKTNKPLTEETFKRNDKVQHFTPRIKLERLYNKTLEEAFTQIAWDMNVSPAYVAVLIWGKGNFKAETKDNTYVLEQITSVLDEYSNIYDKVFTTPLSNNKYYNFETTLLSSKLKNDILTLLKSSNGKYHFPLSKGKVIKFSEIVTDAYKEFLEKVVLEKYNELTKSKSETL